MSGPVRVFGEVLFDRFSDGRSVLGGAPFNVAWHLRAFGLTPMLISRLGDDAPGQAVRLAMHRWGLPDAGLQCDRQLPTGAVDVRLQHGEPSYTIVKPVAWDAIEPPAASGVSEEAGWLYHGTLALRDRRSRAALRQLKQQLPANVFLDVNLRPPWFEQTEVMQQVADADWVKLNEAELRLLAAPAGSLHKQASELFEIAGLSGLIVTRGGAGALIIDHDNGISEAEPLKQVSVVDSVGAGDAFAAVCLLGLCRQWPARLSLERALAFAAAVCSLRGATTEDRSFYQPFAEAWQLHGQGLNTHV